MIVWWQWQSSRVAVPTSVALGWVYKVTHSTVLKSLIVEMVLPLPLLAALLFQVDVRMLESVLSHSAQCRRIYSHHQLLEFS